MTRCRVCGCTEAEACNPPCGWAPGQGNLCTSCAYAVNIVVEWMDIALRPNFAGIVREAKAQYAAEALLTLPRRKTAPPPQKKAAAK